MAEAQSEMGIVSRRNPHVLRLVSRKTQSQPAEIPPSSLNRNLDKSAARCVSTLRLIPVRQSPQAIAQLGCQLEHAHSRLHHDLAGKSHASRRALAHVIAD